MNDHFDRDLIDSMNFAALMTLLETVEESHAKKETASRSASDPEIKTFDPNTDITHGIERLAQLMQTIRDEADGVCGTKTEGDATEVISGLVCGLLFETIKATDATNTEKSSIYNFAVTYSHINMGIDGNMLFPANSNELADLMPVLAEQTVSMIMTGASKANIQIGTGFAQVLVEFLCDVETAIGIHFPSTIFQERLPIIAVNKFIDATKALAEAIEEENPDIKNDPEVIALRQKREHFEELTQAAQAALDSERFVVAQGYYEKILAEAPENWEATFYSVYCDYAAAGKGVAPNDIVQNCTRMGIYACKAVRLAKQQVFSKTDMIAVGKIATNTAHIASNYFVAAMNSFRKSGGNSLKVQRVNAIIKMLFDVGDAVEQSFGDDTAFCSVTACEAWKIALLCYENCNMPVPPTTYEHYQRILKYDPLYHCGKPVVSSTGSSSSGCYIATCVYGSYDCPEVWTLRRYRDYTLVETWYGRAFIRTYYAVSPRLVKWFGHTGWFKNMWKPYLDKIVSKLNLKGYTGTPYYDQSGKEEQRR